MLYIYQTGLQIWSMNKLMFPFFKNVGKKVQSRQNACLQNNRLGANIMKQV